MHGRAIWYDESVTAPFRYPFASAFYPRAHTPKFCTSTFSLQPIYFQSTDLLSDCLILRNLPKADIYFAPSFIIPVGHGCPKGGHICPPRHTSALPWWLKAEGRSAKLRCIRARGQMISVWRLYGRVLNSLAVLFCELIQKTEAPQRNLVAKGIFDAVGSDVGILYCSYLLSILRFSTYLKGVFPVDQKVCL